ncbi:MAG: PQQ-dependent sugar dehydrogenase [Pseudomonadota bacterium]
MKLLTRISAAIGSLASGAAATLPGRWIASIWSHTLGKIAIVLGVLGAFSGTGLLLGGAAYKYEIFPVYRVVEEIDAIINSDAAAANTTAGRVARIETTFLRLAGQVVETPGLEYRPGGGLSVWGDHLLLVHYGGAIGAATKDGTFALTDIEPPDNGLDDLRAAAETPKYEGYTHRYIFHRFNDIEFVESDAVRGLLLSYTYFDGEQDCYGSRVSFLPVSRDAQSVYDVSATENDWETLFDTKPCLELNKGRFSIEGNMAGGRMVFSPPKTLYYGAGDYALDGIYNPDAGVRDLNTSLGKVIKIDMIDKTSSVYASGLRNMQGVALDKQGRLWTTEHGYRGGDELNLIKQDQDYGWPLESLGTHYTGQRLPGTLSFGRHEQFQAPAFAWLPSVAVSTLALIDGFDPSWDGDLLAGSLSSAEYGQSLFRIRVRDERVVFTERIKVGGRVRDIQQFGDDIIALWMDSRELVFLRKTDRPDQLAAAQSVLHERYDDDFAHRIGAVLESCGECHSFEAHVHNAGPSLHGIVGGDIAGASFQGYSTALRSLSGTWSEDRLIAYLKDPASFAPGTTMPASGLTEDTDIEAIIWALEENVRRSAGDMTYD